jgi:uncharacterized surface protein with fasciclin (FAS1) repeats
MKKITKIVAKALMLLALPLGSVGAGLLLSGCSDEPDSSNFYTFTGEMMSDFLKNRPEYSDFYAIVDKAGLTDLLSTYGHYTCFCPQNDAVAAYLQKRGLSSVSELSAADCDTIARTHLVNNMYTTIDMNTDRLPTTNMMGRVIATSQGFDNDSNAVVFIEGTAQIYYALKDDSVENGIMQPINMVIEKSNSYLTDIVQSNPKISTYYAALKATGLLDELLLVEDYEWNPKSHSKYYYTSDFWHEVAWVPDTKKYGFTLFAVPDSILTAKYGIAPGDLRALYEKACELYDPVYPKDVNAEGHSFEHLTDPVNPLRRFMQYQLLNKQVGGTADLTPMEVSIGPVNGAFGIEEQRLNPVDWHYTMLPHTMMKVEQLTMTNYVGKGTLRERYINRRYDKNHQIEGQHIDPTIDTEYVHDGLNGHYFYVDDIVAFTDEVKNVVHNDRIRMDFSTIFPEVIGNNLRYEGNPEKDDNSGSPDDASVPANGRNYYFPLGYLEGVTFTNCTVVLRRPHINFWSWQGDEWNLFGDYDFTFRIPPVPYSGDWQLRLGFCALGTRGVMQTYFDGIPQGIPLDMTKNLDSDLYIGSRFGNTTENSVSDYDSKSDEEKAEEQKLLKNLGAYRAPRSLFHFSTSERNYFVKNPRTYRRILCQTYIDASKDHYLRYRVASDGKQGNNNEFMLDYFEMVPKSVYGVDGTGEMEDDN